MGLARPRRFLRYCVSVRVPYRTVGRTFAKTIGSKTKHEASMAMPAKTKLRGQNRLAPCRSGNRLPRGVLTIVVALSLGIGKAGTGFALAAVESKPVASRSLGAEGVGTGRAEEPVGEVTERRNAPDFFSALGLRRTG